MTDWKGKRLQARPFPLQPLLDATRLTIEEIADCTGRQADTIRDYLDRGMTFRAADQLACSLGWHPGCIWPDYWTEDADVCANGHVRTEKNTRVNHDGSRQCRDCSNERARQSRLRRQGVAA